MSHEKTSTKAGNLGAISFVRVDVKLLGSLRVALEFEGNG